jgi:hypothetical protein
MWQFQSRTHGERRGNSIHRACCDSSGRSRGHYGYFFGVVALDAG